MRKSPSNAAADDAALVARARAGEEAAAAEIYRRHAPRLYAVVRRLAGDDETAEDWAQETWIRALTGLGAFRAESRLSTWLHRVAFNTAVSLRRVGRWRTSGGELPDSIAGRDRVDAVVDRVALERALARLPAGMRAAVVLHDVEGYRHEEIAEILGVRASTSRSQLYKARVRLAELLAPDPEPATRRGT
jgi:RNA polymerase sigma-70 factor (ECF subfamily)